MKIFKGISSIFYILTLMNYIRKINLLAKFQYILLVLLLILIKTFI